MGSSGEPWLVMVVANLESKINFLSSQIATFVSPGWTRNHRSHPVNRLQIKLWKTAGHGLCTMSESDAKWPPPGITPLFWLLGWYREDWGLNAVGKDTEEVKMNIVELWSHSSQIALGLVYLRNWTLRHLCFQFDYPHPQVHWCQCIFHESVFIFLVMLFLFPLPCLNLLSSTEVCISYFISHPWEPWARLPLTIVIKWN